MHQHGRDGIVTGRAHADALRWAEHGTGLFGTQVALLDEESMAAPSLLPGWTRKHLVAHVAANADALGNLVHWARTGDRTPMYSSARQRDSDIETGATRSADELVTWLNASVRALSVAMESLSDDDWRREVVTAQGRTVPATEIPWLRAREVCVHAVDLGTGATFADLPDEFLAALVADIRARRGLDAVPRGPLPEVAAYLAGRSHSLADVPGLGPWL
ncbi:maleylpyruvate isomerase family mycothiol-dependent enzyme [Nocardia africana]|uniref:Mycothiol-dependent maleylpyruvate isomerase n=1 Tax=Nocardia africana TaxID=134964 RepID=A0A378WY37_9NOCA|nr:maleylpyruvate isomerase family mycothiol-dependent enzyme [Nocardia africana]MCC3312579.1 maleylpyruvate isomerase family mycothiol-dependent enzyme [Nocardia africana]SUA46099.1 mycothiol-dependent maleylpyruvate isomerase [Nocardia africana]